MQLKNSKGGIKFPKNKLFAQALKCNDPDFIDFIKQCFIWDPAKRIKPDKALQHNWILKGLTEITNAQKPKINSTISLENNIEFNPDERKGKNEINKSLLSAVKDNVLMGTCRQQPNNILSTPLKKQDADKVVILKEKLNAAASKQTNNANARADKKKNLLLHVLARQTYLAKDEKKL